MSSAPRPADQDARDEVVRERQRNVIIDAGAGTGKTSTLVRRLVNMVAPLDGAPPVPIERIAAVTFTNRAAGELRLRIREELLEALGELPAKASRAQALREALAGLDSAAIGTIHSFSDRLLRQKPVEAQLSPQYEIFEDEGALIGETVQILMRAADLEELPENLGPEWTDEKRELVREALGTALAADLKREDYEHEFGVSYGLEGLIAGFIRNRDVDVELPGLVPLDVASLRALSDELASLVGPLPNAYSGVRQLKGIAKRLADVLGEDEERRIVAGVLRVLAKPPDVSLRDSFQGDKDAWDVWNAFKGDNRKNPVRDTGIRDDLLAPTRAWLASRLVQMCPIAIEVYERVKARHRALDQVDLLLKLRDLLESDRDSRCHYQSLFDHVFVDEFQDTDPLQAEIILYLCEAGANAERWEDVVLEPGKLTIVGDAKQSIYRFRRADVAMYDRVRRKIEESGALSRTLSTNFRSVRPLIDWLNGRFPEVLGPSPSPDVLFDASSGQVYYQPLDVGRADEEAEQLPAVHRVPYGDPSGPRLKAAECRDLEGVALARYVRWLVGNPDVLVRDRETGRRRPVRHGDIAVLALATYELQRLFRQLDAEGIPHSVRGGTLFLRDELHRRFLLGLRAIADRDDGVAMATLLRPPFFAVDPADLLLERAEGADESDPRVARARDAWQIVRDLRARRYVRPVGETARDLLERTALAAWVASRPNGSQRLRHLREICSTLEQNAAAEGLDYDQATRRLRDWVSSPVQLDPPLPVGADAVQVITVHQAKGLEFPVVILWDGRAEKTSPDRKPAWRVSRDGRSWAIRLSGFECESSSGASLSEQEAAYRDHERARLVYVAATRARDVLVLPGAPGLSARYIHDWFSGKAPAQVWEMDAYVRGSEPRWAITAPRLPAEEPVAWLEDVDARWSERADVSGDGRWRPIAVTTAAKTSPRDDVDAAAAAIGPTAGVEDGEGAEVAGEGKERRSGRFGPAFGTAVHLAMGGALRNPTVSTDAHVERAVQSIGLEDHLVEVREDVERGLRVVRRVIAEAGGGLTFRLEYPVCGIGSGDSILLGSIDFILLDDTAIHIVDFKTDPAPADNVISTAYREQLWAYGRLLRESGLPTGQALRLSILFTENGALVEC